MLKTALVASGQFKISFLDGLYKLIIYYGNIFYKKRFHSFAPEIMEPLTKILSASVELFRQFGFKTITMDDIARRAGISKKTLYQHFANKNEIVTESVSWYQCRISDSCIVTLDESENAIEGMVRIMGMLDQVFRQTNPTALLELERFYPEGFRKFKESIIQNDVEAIKRNIIQGIGEGLYRPETDPEFMARLRMELSMIVFRPNLLTENRENLSSVGNAIGEHFLYGIMTHKGEKLYQKYKEQYIKQVSKI